MRKSAKCDFFLNLMKKSLTFRLWQNCEKSSLFPLVHSLAPFDIQELREITMYDELELDTLGGTEKGDTQKTVLFFIMSDTDEHL